MTSALLPPLIFRPSAPFPPSAARFTPGSRFDEFYDPRSDLFSYRDQKESKLHEREEVSLHPNLEVEKPLAGFSQRS